MGIAAHTQQPEPPRPADTPGPWLNAAVATCTLVFICGLSLLIGACTSSSGDENGVATPGAGSVKGTSVTAQPADGMIDLPDQTLSFSMSTCSILPDSFIAAGSGTTTDGESFFVKVESPGSMSIRFGVDDEDAVQPDDASFYRAVESARLVGADSMITGTIKVSDVNVAPDDEFDASVRINCA